MKQRRVSPEATVGILVLAGIVLLFFMSFRVTRLERVKGELYTAVFPSVTGLAVNGIVEVAGVHVGKVEKIGLERGKAKVWLRIGKVQPRQDAEAIIRTAGVLGDKYVQIKLGSPEFPVIPPGGTIAFVKSAPDIDELFATIQATAQDIGALGRSVQEVVGGEEGSTALRDMISNLQQASSGINELISENKTKVGRLITNLEEFSGGLTPLSQRAERTLANLEEMTAKVKGGEGTLGKDF